MVEAVMWMFGFTRKEAVKYCASASIEALKLIKEGYEKQGKLAFNCD